MLLKGSFIYDQQKVSDMPHFSERQSHHILPYDQQEVSANTPDISERQSHHILSYYDQQNVSNIFFYKVEPSHLVL